MKTKQELISILTAANLWPTRHLPQSTGQLFDRYHSIITENTVRMMPGVLSSGQFDAYVYQNLEHPHSPLVIFRSPIIETKPPGSGVLAQSHIASEPLDFLRFYSGKQDGWHGCAEKASVLLSKLQEGRWLYSGQLL